MKYKANILWHNKEKSWMQQEELQADNLDQPLLIGACCSLVSHGTERTVTTHALDPAVAAKMAVPYMKGSLSDTFSYGYSVVGKVLEGSSEYVGRYVHLMHPHQDYFFADAGSVYALPEEMNPETMTLASNLETAVNALWDAEIEIGDKVQIIGYGIIGALVAKLVSRLPGVLLDVKETHEARRQLAVSHGYRATDKSISDDYDIIFNTSGAEGALQEAIAHTMQEGKIIELSWYGTREISLSLGSDFHYGRKRIISSQVSHIPSRKLPRWNYTNRKELVFRLLSALDFTDLLGSEIDFEETPVFYDRLRNGQVADLCTIIKY